MASCDLPYFCPRCGDDKRFGDVPALRSHLVSRHTYETLLVLSQARARSSRPGTLLPLLNHTAARPDHPVLGTERDGRPVPLACLDLACSSASAQLLRDMFTSRDWGGGATSKQGEATSPTGPPHSAMALALPGSLGPVPRGNSPAELDLRGLVCLGLGPSLGLEFGLDGSLVLGLDERLGLGLDERLGLGLDERLGLGLERRIARTFAEVEERVAQRVGHLRAELERREVELQRERQEAERLGREKEDLEEQASHLSRQVAVSVEMMAALKRDLKGKEQELGRKQQEVCEMEQFLTVTAEREAEAKRSYSVSGPQRREQLDQHMHGSPIGRLRTLSLGSGGWDSDTAGGWGTPQEAHSEPHHCPGPCSPREGRKRRQKGYSHTPEVRGVWGQSWRRAPHSTEEEEDGDDEDTSWSEDTSDPPEPLRYANKRPELTHTTGVSSVQSNPCPRGNRALGVETLRLRAGLFCVFPYLDIRTLLLAAEVCSDWRFVARHPAVWTRVRLENARVSAKFLVTLSQWCTQTQSLVLQNLKPRPRHRDQCREDYYQNTRGCLEGGVEALLRSAGGSLLMLHVSHCPHVLTDRCLWLASCYCRNLLQLTYRSSSDPMGHEVVWALGAGCRNIQSLQVAPLHPCQQPTRFSNRCLQTIGRCWPHLRILSVGGAGCDIQGLAVLVRSCAGLQVLELECVTEIGQEEAAELCREGLQNLETLLLTSTPVTPKALLHFSSVCNNLQSMVVQAGIADYGDEPDSAEAKRLYDDTVNKLQALKKRPGLSEVLQIKADGYV
ncbi:F-box only protein 41 isoform X2 [Esox lucius]|uniref:F-box only protein 41 isoform X2 n=1 Tax=Esox lucius TaxID=8010 RepID=UPI001476D45F|nr:F-box only protein 41 isoform X2 [Esox lucius]